MRYNVYRYSEAGQWFLVSQRLTESQAQTILLALVQLGYRARYARSTP